MSLKDDLIAAKALIDTPEKYSEMRTITAALGEVARDDDTFIEMRTLLRKINGGLLIGSRLDAHRNVMALFDRAIEAAP